VFPLKDNIPTLRTPVVTIALIVANVVFYLFFQKKTGIDFTGNSLNQHDLFDYAAVPYEFSHPGEHCQLAADQTAALCGNDVPDGLPTLVTVFTAMFAHAGLLHLGGNMLFLWIFGNNVEDAMGRVKFLLFYLGAGIAALALQVVVGPDEAVPTLGASGAVAGILGGYLLLYPRARVVTVVFVILFFTVIELPAIVFLVIWFAQQALFGAADLTNPTGGSGGVAYFAHIGGFVFGLLLVKVLATRHKDVPAARFPVY
jgi:membrane associated rhomboid family serine protease